ncbi:FAD-binding oxidoreductase [Sphingomonas sp. MMS12-HWE2-04]|uniref:FAD-binding oxidoreductase n=1 Tax=Sphingomonas sp. MMS12-HWE2-04 TaxID=3234199 RepID=UPI003851275E
MPTVTLRNRRSFSADESEILLDAALRQGVVLEHSCRTGRCGVCIADATGTTRVVRHEEGLSDEDAQAGKVLTCCRTAVDDVELGVESLDRLAGLRSKILPCRIGRLERHSDDLLVATLRLPPTLPLKFLPGQHVNVIHGAVRRSYSLANAPRADNTVELHIRRYPGGVMSAYWFEQAAVGDLLRLEGPLGTFFLREMSCERLLLLCTGTGIAPAKAMLEEIAAAGSPFPPTTLIWGNRTRLDFNWDPSQVAMPIEFIPVLSRPDATWSGATGYVQHQIEALDTSMEGVDVYACGSNDMIADLGALLKSSGHPEHRFYYDAFVRSQ